MRWRRKYREHDLDRELRAHLELEAEERQDSGMTPEQARQAARRAFGSVAFTKEEVRRMWGWTFWQILFQDLRFAFRSLGKSPGFTITAILTLALGIGASTAVFTVVDSVILKPLSYPDSGSLVVAWERVRKLGGEPVGPNPRHVEFWRERATAFRSLTFFRHMSMGLAVDADHPRLAGAVACIPNLFDVLQVQPVLGRTFTPQDGARGSDNVAVISHGLWQSLFQGDSSVIGKTIHLDAVPRTVIGVLPAGFHFPNRNAIRSAGSAQTVSGTPEPELFFPAPLNFSQFEWNGNFGNWMTVGRLNAGVTVSEAEAQLNAIQAQALQHPANQGDRSPGALLASVQPMQEAIVGNTRRVLWLLMGAVMGLMLIACLNLANAQLGRALARSREAAVRAALGAARWRLAWSALTESLALALIGGGVGILIAYGGVNLFRRYSPVDLPRLSEVQLNVNVLLFSIFLTFAASVLSGLLPALRLLSTDPQPSLKQNSARSVGSRLSHRVRTFLIGLQIFGCTALLLVTGLFSKSLLHLLRQDKGFEAERVTIGEAALSPQLYGKDQSRIAFTESVLENLRALPGVQSAGLVSFMPLEGGRWIEFAQRVDRPDQQTPLINLRWVSPGYFETTQHKLVAGRFVDERDRNLDSVVLSEGEAKALWGGENPIGGQVVVRGRARTVVGVVADSRNTSLKLAPPKMAYLHYGDQPPFTLFFVARSSHSSDALASGMRQAIWKVAPDAMIARIKTLDAHIADSLATERFQTFLFMGFGISALLLAMLGIYGVLSFSVASRKQEIGVRMALGATRGSIYSLTIGQAGVPVIVGLATGLGAGFLAARVVQSLLHGTQLIEPGVILIVIAVLLASAAAAAFLPARRGASVDPMDALRSE